MQDKPGSLDAVSSPNQVCVNCGYQISPDLLDRPCSECGLAPLSERYRPDVLAALRSPQALLHHILRARALPVGWWWAFDRPDDRPRLLRHLAMHVCISSVIAVGAILIGSVVAVEVKADRIMEWTKGGVEIVGSTPWHEERFALSAFICLVTGQTVQKGEPPPLPTPETALLMSRKGKTNGRLLAQPRVTQISRRIVLIRPFMFFSTCFWGLPYLYALWGIPCIPLSVLIWRKRELRSMDRLAAWNCLISCGVWLPIFASVGVLCVVADTFLRLGFATVVFPQPVLVRRILAAIPAGFALVAWWLTIRNDRTGRLLRAWVRRP